ncbi:putative membrane protein [Labilithrix luteola]|uniref:Putative membrane protein n=1 Tax=Labilithrix luteola TaxID=1391654 RepID=A0A0K1QCA5_9BACT|nr:DoxX family protein [Labilithrix luteola]AKV03358.1 putative membrane protein [Labilithrix luteola]
MSFSLSRLESPAVSAFGPTALRIALGSVFVAHALAKAFTFTFPGTVQFFESFGIPGFTVYPVFFAELLGGLSLIVGFRTRAVALLLVPVMLGALVPHINNGWMFSNNGGGWEYVAFLIVALGAQALVGSGAYAVDSALSRARKSDAPVLLRAGQR